MEDNISGGTVNYDIVGEGIPIVMLHGGPGDLLYMKGLMEPVFQEHSNWQRLYLDLPGCGLTKTALGRPLPCSIERVIFFHIAEHYRKSF